jgi:protein-arginine kinase activator protein McsA
MTCDMCHQDKQNVRTVIDPYNSELNDEEIEMNLCEECEQERRDSI